MDFTDITDSDLDALRVEVLTEQERRRTLASAPAMAENGIGVRTLLYASDTYGQPHTLVATGTITTGAAAASYVTSFTPVTQSDFAQ